MRPDSDTEWVQQRAMALGFDLCGVVRAETFPELARTQEWLARGYAGEMNYLSDPRRRDPSTVMPELRRVIVCALNYNTEQPKSTEVRKKSDAGDPDLNGREVDNPRGWISRYAWGDDYHDILRGKLEGLVAALRERFSEGFHARVYADTGPIQERVLAKYAGLGWLGKNTLLLNQRLGSWFFLGAILTTLELTPSLAEAEPPPDLCGSCRKCIDACPTDALVEPYVLDARRCISYLTIELRGSIPEDLRSPMGNHVFGCDICQEVCPWNKRAPVTNSVEFAPRVLPPAHDDVEQSVDDSLYLPRLERLASMSEEQFRTVFRGSAVKRTKWRGIVRNACIALGNAELHRDTPQHTRIAALLDRLALSPDAVIAESALWALSRIQ